MGGGSLKEVSRSLHVQTGGQTLVRDQFVEHVCDVLKSIIRQHPSISSSDL